MKKLIPLAILALTLSACGGGGNGGGDSGPLSADVAVIAARAPDYSSGAISLVNTDAPYAGQNNLNASTSDISVRSGGDHYFRLEKFDTNQISRYEAATPGAATWTYSTQDATDTGDSNPYDLIIASPTKAYLLRYGSAKMWIVNPSATTEAAFKTGEIDLSGYDTFDGIPEMAGGIIRGGRLYVVMQRLENFSATKTGYVAVFDVATDAEITTGAAGAALKGVELTVRNPANIAATPDGDLLVFATGAYNSTTFAPLYDGGIERIDSTTFAKTLILDDGTPAAHPYGQITNMAIVDNGRGYFIGSTGFAGNQTVYRFNPGAASTPVAVTGLTAGLYGALAVSPSGQLFVGLDNSAAPGVAIAGFSGGTETIITPRVDTVLTPINIDFVVVDAQ
ncbi:hypothetical protein DFR24_3621 [Panacagrimonas perspica]|uniref:Lipoprotein n=1 Tax=Panacagrimonas perspica TaxID=381431 RepID=A0A4R7P029_9GAMM|nr:hypothetical protein [Panacagrimonas perspica]TDU26592.1 hypothetical protein DFR24_3621 [Panacagrimonas perspica]THD03957.1 hypothetical protein B1810_06730 [Panacagrimonas perspica]